MSSTTTESPSIKQDCIIFLKLFSATAFIILVLELSQYYDVHLRVWGHLDILRITGFTWFVIIPLLVGFSGVFAMLAALMRRVGFSDSYFKTAIQVACVTVVILAFSRAFILCTDRLFPGSVIRDFYPYWFIRTAPFAIGTVTVLLYMQRNEALRRWFNNVADLLWMPILPLSLGVLIWVGPFFIRCGIEAATEFVKNEKSLMDKPNVIIITFDALATRDMSLYGYHRKTTPYMDEFAKECFVFDNMHTNYPSTGIALASMLIGTYPWTHKALDTENLPIELDGALTHETESISTVLKEYYSIAQLDVGWNIGMATKFNFLLGPQTQGIFSAFFTKYCRYYCDMLYYPTQIPLPVSQLLMGGKEQPMFMGGLDFLKKLKTRPFFLWFHILAPHDPYRPPPPIMGTFLPTNEGYPVRTPGYYKEFEQTFVDKLRARYDEYILYVDTCLTPFIDGLKETGLYDNILIIISSDHGEQFERGYYGHGDGSLYEPVLHVPLLIHLPNQSYGSRISVLAEHVDIAPTILDVLGKPAPSWMEGKSLLPYINGKPSGNETTYAGNLGKRMGVFSGNYKLIVTPIRTEDNEFKEFEYELYNLKEDREELHNLLNKEPSTATFMKELVPPGYTASFMTVSETEG